MPEITHRTIETNGIRMRIADAEWLFERVRVGTTVFIVRA